MDVVCAEPVANDWARLAQGETRNSVQRAVRTRPCLFRSKYGRWAPRKSSKPLLCISSRTCCSLRPGRKGGSPPGRQSWKARPQRQASTRSWPLGRSGQKPCEKKRPWSEKNSPTRRAKGRKLMRATDFGRVDPQEQITSWKPISFARRTGRHANSPTRRAKGRKLMRATDFGRVDPQEQITSWKPISVARRTGRHAMRALCPKQCPKRAEATRDQSASLGEEKACLQSGGSPFGGGGGEVAPLILEAAGGGWAPSAAVGLWKPPRPPWAEPPAKTIGGWTGTPMAALTPTRSKRPFLSTMGDGLLQSFPKQEGSIKTPECLPRAVGLSP